MMSTSENEKNQICRHVAGFDRPRVLEVGAFKGETTRLLAEVASERRGYVVAIDPMRWSAELISNGLRRHLPKALGGIAQRVERLMGAASYEDAFWATVGDAKPYVHLRRARSDDAALLASDEPILEAFDVVFIDGDHSHRGATNDLREWGVRVAPGGVILVHDAVPAFPGVVLALTEFEQEIFVQVEWPAEGSLAVIRVDRDLRSIPSANDELSRSDAAE